MQSVKDFEKLVRHIHKYWHRTIETQMRSAEKHKQLRFVWLV